MVGDEAVSILKAVVSAVQERRRPRDGARVPAGQQPTTVPLHEHQRRAEFPSHVVALELASLLLATRRHRGVPVETCLQLVEGEGLVGESPANRPSHCCLFSMKPRGPTPTKSSVRAPSRKAASPRCSAAAHSPTNSSTCLLRSSISSLPSSGRSIQIALRTRGTTTITATPWRPAPRLALCPFPASRLR